MTARPTKQQALKWLEEQIKHMGELRNATTRDGGFKQWRQSTVTVLQRIWPDQPAHAYRFRRVPFAPPSARADEQEARECFEKGFAEARGLLKLWVADINHRGLEGASEEETAPAGDADTEATGPPSRHEPRSRHTPRGKQKGRLKDMLGFGEWPPTRDLEGEGPGRGAGTSRDASPDVGSTSRAAAESRDSSSGSKGAGRAARGAAANSERSGSKGRKHAAGSAPQAAVKPDALAQTISDALKRSRSEGSAPATPAARGAGLRIEHGFGEPGTTSGGLGPAREIAELSFELGRLDVPESDRNFVGVAMVELARRLDSGDMTWAEIRQAVSLVMQYPSLARRVLPLLLPYFEAAA